MLVPIKEQNEENEAEELEEKQRAWNDLLRNANTSMMSWAEKNFKQKLIDTLYRMRYYKYNQTIYLRPLKKDK